MSTFEALKTLIVGCGNIAGGFDSKEKAFVEPLTHAEAYLLDGRFNVTACVEPNTQRRTDFMCRWGIGVGFNSLKEVVDSGLNFDVISICSPTINHADDLRDSITLKPKVIFCEKPLTESSVEGKELVADCFRQNIKLAVNLTRRWDQQIIKLRQDILNEEVWGKLRGVAGSYNKGILNNGIHLVDLLNYLLGPVHLVHAGAAVFDYSKVDPTVSIWLEDAKGTPILISSGHAMDYAIFELQFIFSGGVLAMENGGISWRKRRSKESMHFSGYKVLEKGELISGRYLSCMGDAVKNIYDAIKKGDPLLSTGDNALSAMVLCEEIRDRALRSNVNNIK